MLRSIPRAIRRTPRSALIRSITQTGGPGKDDQSSGPARTTPPKGKAPANFFDEEVEREQEFLDMSSALLNEGGMTFITRVQQPLSWQEIEDMAQQPYDAEGMLHEANLEATEVSVEAAERIDMDHPDVLESSTMQIALDEVTPADLSEHLEKFSDSYVPEEYINYSVDWKDNEGIEDPLLDKFVPLTAPERYTYNTQGHRACPGKLQRRGKKGVLGCHLIDLDALHYLDVVDLRRFLSDDAEIMGRKHTGLCSKCQRKVAKCIKTARQLGVLPHIGQYFVEDGRPSHVDRDFHDVVRGQDRVESKTVF